MVMEVVEVTPNVVESRWSEGDGGDVVRLVCISDTHTAHRTLTIPPGDILVHSGDFTNYGTTREAVSYTHLTLPTNREV